MSRSVKTIATIPDCPKCGKPMRHLSTGDLIRTYYCAACKETLVVKREDKRNKAFIDKVKTIQISGKATPTRGRK